MQNTDQYFNIFNLFSSHSFPRAILELLASDHGLRYVLRVEAREWHLSHHYLPEQTTICVHVDAAVVASLLEQLRSHVSWCTGELHRSLAEVSL